MPSSLRKRPLVLLALGLAAVACGDAAGPGGPGSGGPGPLTAGLWTLREIGDSTLSATAATRTIGISTEATIVDSSKLEIEIDGSYSQRYWTRVLIDGQLDRQEVVLDLGSWALGGGGYQFTSEVRTRAFVVIPISGGRLQTNEAFATWIGAPSNTAIYRLATP